MSSPSFEQNRCLNEVTTFGIGGPAHYFIEVRTVEGMSQVLKYCHTHTLPFFILGKGSNTLFDDRGFKGVVIANRIVFFEQPSEGLFHVGAGYSFSLLGSQTARQGWSGLEFASGIPASVGGAIFMNAGANKRETCESLVSVDFVTAEGEIKTIPRKDIEFKYRHSSFQKVSGAILGATFQLEKASGARQHQLEIIQYRKSTQPYSDKSAGCMFRNPDIGPAGMLIDKCGLKGFKVGGAAVSSMHANFIVNKDSATSCDILHLIEEIKRTVKEKTGIDLESEVRYIPYE